MGSGSSCLAATVAPLNVSTTDEDGAQALLDKLASQPALLSKPVPGLSLLLGGVAQTWMHVACERKQVQVVQHMLDFLAGSNPATMREALGPYCRRTGAPLPETAAEGVRLAVGMCNGRGQTPLMHACYAGCPALVNLLLDKGADPWAADKCGCRTALHYAAIAGCAGCVSALLRCSAAQQRQHRQGSLEGTRYADVPSQSGLTPLHYAVYFERHGVLRELLRHDPDINAPTAGPADGSGNGQCGGGGGGDASWWLHCEPASTPLHLAAGRGNATAVLELLRYYAARRHSGAVSDPRLARTASGRQPWHLAASQYPSLRYLGGVLHPGQPLTRVVGGSDGAQNPNIGAPSLASIAATALRQKLLAAVTAAEAAVAAAAVAADAVAVRDRGVDETEGKEAGVAAGKAGWGWPLARQAFNGHCIREPTSEQHPFGVHEQYDAERGQSPTPAAAAPAAAAAGGRRVPCRPCCSAGAATAATQQAGPLLLPATLIPGVLEGRDSPSSPLLPPPPLQRLPTGTEGTLGGRSNPGSGSGSGSGSGQTHAQRGDGDGDGGGGATPCIRTLAAAHCRLRVAVPSGEPPAPVTLPGSPLAAVAAAAAASGDAAGTATRDGYRPGSPLGAVASNSRSMRSSDSSVVIDSARSSSSQEAAGSPLVEQAPARGAGAGRRLGAASASGGADGTAEAEGEGGDVTCSLCFARPQVVAPATCRHGMCASCARELCHGLTARPLPCPFCRRPITDFVRLAAAQSQPQAQALVLLPSLTAAPPPPAALPTPSDGGGGGVAVASTAPAVLPPLLVPPTACVRG